MPARRTIDGAVFGPEVVRAAIAAFDAAWEEIADHFGTDMREQARERLATSIISAAREDSTDADVLRKAGLSAMGRIYPHQLTTPTAQSSTDASGTGN